MTAASATLAGRVAAERNMLDTCTASAAGVFDPESGVPTPGPALYTGRCKVQTFLPQEQNPEVAGATVTVQRYFVHFPVARTVADYEPAAGHIVEITASAHDPHLVGRSFRIVAPHFETNGTAYRVGVEELS